MIPILPVPSLVEVKNTWGTLSRPSDAEVEIAYRASAFDALITALRPTGAGPLEFLYRLEGVEQGPVRSARGNTCVTPVCPLVRIACWCVCGMRMGAPDPNTPC